ncbi:hypothetical protein [Rubrivirga sp.]|uniref:hypothetical protein n=1 Tax=Rubrivirga sp. TaxID=1885344 RepID=UPI003B523374
MRALALSLLFAVGVFAQDVDPGFTVVVSPYLTPFVPLSAEAQAVAEAGAFGHTEDPLRMLDNPAVLAGFGDGVRVSGHLLTDWLGADDLQSAGGAVAAGWRATLAGLPATVGVGLAYGSFRQPVFDPLADGFPTELPAADEIQHDWERTVSLGVGVGVEGPVRVRAGVAGRSLRSVPLFDVFAPEPGGERASALVADLGLDVTAPVGRWLQPEPTAAGVRGVIDVTLGYALLGIGLTESDAPSGYFAQPERQAMAGISLRAGVDVRQRSATPLRAVEAEFLTGAEDPGAAAFGLSASNVLLGADPSSQAVVRRAGRLTLGETVALSAGTMEGATFVERDSWGFTISAGGALRLVGALADRPDLHALGGRFDLRYTYARYTFDPGPDPFATTPAHGLVVRVRP